MDPELVVAVVAAAASLALGMASETIRTILKTIFRRPRQASVIMEVDGKRVSVSGDDISMALRALEDLLNERGTEVRAEPTAPASGSTDSNDQQGANGGKRGSEGVADE